jgi:hypothetical protein
MSNIFTLQNFDNFTDKLNLDELYERKKLQDQNELDLYNKILNRVHVRIKLTSKQNSDVPMCWFLVPEVIIGVPKYNQANCIGYLITKLKTNGFRVRYVDPNLLMISWGHFVPSYVRQEFKKKFGQTIDENGNIVNESDDISKSKDNTANYLVDGLSKTSSKPVKKFNPTSSYKPSGQLY